MNKIELKKVNQKYLKELLLQYPKINSGRKNYIYQYKRVLKNILLSKLYLKKIIPNKNNILFSENKLFMKIETNKK